MVMNGGLVCPDARTLARFSLGLLPGDDSTELERHLGACRRCGERLRAEPSSDPVLDAIRRGPYAEADPLADDLIHRCRGLRRSPDADVTLPPGLPGETRDLTALPFLGPALG